MFSTPGALSPAAAAASVTAEPALMALAFALPPFFADRGGKCETDAEYDDDNGEDAGFVLFVCLGLDLGLRFVAAVRERLGGAYDSSSSSSVNTSGSSSSSSSSSSPCTSSSGRYSSSSLLSESTIFRRRLGFVAGALPPLSLIHI